MKPIRFSAFFLIIMGSIFLSFPNNAACVGPTIITNPNIWTNTNWTLADSPYIVTVSVNIGNSATLTIEAGATVKFQSSKSLTVGTSTSDRGSLKILGTAALPVLITADHVSPTPGFWSAINLTSYTNLPTIVQYAQIEYAQRGLSINTISPDVHSTVFRNNSVAGISTYGTVVLNSYQNSFVGNGKGIEINTPTSSTSIKSILSWWNHITGPSGAGTGSGQFATSGTIFEPWLETAPVYTNELNSASVVNRTFNPNGGINNHVNYSSIASASWTFTYVNSSSQVVRTFTGTGQSTNIVWDGRNDSGALQPSGTYSYRIQSSGSATATGKVVMSLTQTPAITGADVQPPFFSPNNNGNQDTTTVTANFNFDGGQWTVNVKNPGGTTIRTFTTGGTSINWVWDGKDSGGVLQPEGAYTVQINVVDDAANLTTNKTATLDLTYPIAAITNPAPNFVASNIYQNNTIAITGTATDLNLLSWTIKKCNPSCGTTLASGTTPKTNALFYNWNTASEPNATNLQLFLDVRDKAGNWTQIYLGPLTVGNFALSQNVRQLNASASQTVTYTSTVPFTLNEQIIIKNAQGQTVRDLFNGSRNAGSFPDVFDGKDGSNVILPDGPYYVVVNITKDTYNFTWDQTNQYLGSNTQIAYAPSTPWDPYNNLPFTASITLTEPKRVTVAVTTVGLANGDCSAPTVCLVNDEYQPSGVYTFVWPGVDNNGVIRPDLKLFGIAAQLGHFSKNAVVVFGTKPTITNLILSPPLFNPGLGNQNINFNLSTYQSQPANVTITIFNQASRSILRTINQSSVAAGSVSIPWDGKADNGIRVSGDPYLVTVSATDNKGQQVTAKALMVVRY